MESNVPNWPLIGMTLVFAALLLLDFEFGIEPAAYLAFVPALIWGAVMLARSRR